MNNTDAIMEEAARIDLLLRVEYSKLIREYNPSFASTAMIDSCVAMIGMALVAVDSADRDLAISHIAKEIDRRSRDYDRSWQAFAAGAESARKRMEDEE